MNRYNLKKIIIVVSFLTIYLVIIIYCWNLLVTC